METFHWKEYSAHTELRRLIIGTKMLFSTVYLTFLHCVPDFSPECVCAFEFSPVCVWVFSSVCLTFLQCVFSNIQILVTFELVNGRRRIWSPWDGELVIGTEMLFSTVCLCVLLFSSVFVCLCLCVWSPWDGELVIGTEMLAQEIKEDLEALLFKYEIFI